MKQPLVKPQRDTAPLHSTQGAAVHFFALEKRYGTVTALLPTTLDVRSGEFFAIIGPSGSGKSTLLGVTAGFIPASGGQILDGGREHRLSAQDAPPAATGHRRESGAHAGSGAARGLR